MTQMLPQRAREWLRAVNSAVADALNVRHAPDEAELDLGDVVVHHRWNGETINSLVKDARRESGLSERLPDADPQLVVPASYADVLVNAVGRVRKRIRDRS